ncbi:MAG: VPLPA-CTERM sorting domain-containing protein [Pseudomonadota bacterium]|nr:VPLPA-CTERM sorting domain-containing protein [Pseudomonadota bacterium]
MTRFFLTAAVAVTLSATSSLAATRLNDGGFHVINGPSDTLSVSLDTDVQVTAGANISTPPTSDVRSYQGISISGGSLTVDGGRITGQSTTSSNSYGEEGIYGSRTEVTVSDGAIAAGDGTQGGGAAMRLFQSTASISGGRFSGGDTIGGYGGDALSLLGGTTSITGGMFFAGSGNIIDGDALFVGLDAQLSISGGSFTATRGGSHALRTSDSSVLNLTGGSFAGAFAIRGFSVVNVFGTGLLYENDRLTGFLNNGDRINVGVTLANTAQLNLNPSLPAVPLPAGLPLMLAGLGSLAALRRRAKG